MAVSWDSGDDWDWDPNFAVDLGRWKPDLHPRDSGGKFRDKWGLSPRAMRDVDALLARFDAPALRSDAHAASYLKGQKGPRSVQQKQALEYFLTREGNEDVQSTLRGGDEDTKVIRELRGMTRPTEHDMIASRVVGPDAFGLRPEQMDGVEEWTGKLVTDAGFQPTNIGNAYQVAGPHVEMRILVPKGTPAIIVGDDGGPDEARTVILGPETNLRLGKIQKDGRGGWYVLATVAPKQGTGTPRALGGRPLGARDKAPAIDATPDELERRGISPDEAAVPGSQEQPGRFGPAEGGGTGERTLPQQPGQQTQSIPNPAGPGAAGNGTAAQSIEQSGGDVPAGAGKVMQEGEQPEARPKKIRLSRQVVDEDVARAADTKRQQDKREKDQAAREERARKAEEVLAKREARLQQLEDQANAKDAAATEQLAKANDSLAKTVDTQQKLIERLMDSEGGTRAAGLTEPQKEAVLNRVRDTVGARPGDENDRVRDLARQITEERRSGGTPAKKAAKKAGRAAAPEEAPGGGQEAAPETPRATAEQVAEFRAQEEPNLSAREKGQVRRLGTQGGELYWAQRESGSSHEEAVAAVGPRRGGIVAAKKATPADLVAQMESGDFTPDEMRDTLQGYTKKDLIEILKGVGVTGGPRSGARATKADIIQDIVVFRKPREQAQPDLDGVDTSLDSRRARRAVEGRGRRDGEESSGRVIEFPRPAKKATAGAEEAAPEASSAPAAKKAAKKAARTNYTGKQVRGSRIKELAPGDVVEVPSRGGEERKTVRVVDGDTIVFTDGTSTTGEAGSVRVISQTGVRQSAAARAKEKREADRKIKGLGLNDAIKAYGNGDITAEQLDTNLRAKLADLRGTEIALIRLPETNPEKAREIRPGLMDDLRKTIAGVEKLQKEIRENPRQSDAERTAKSTVRRDAREALTPDEQKELEALAKPAKKATRGIKKAAPAAPELDASRPDAGNLTEVRAAKTVGAINAIADERGVRIPSTVGRREDRRAFLEKALSVQDGESKADYDARMKELKSPSTPVKRGRGRPRKVDQRVEAPAPVKATKGLRRAGSNDEAPERLDAEDARNRLESQLTERQRGQVDRLPTLQDKENYWSRRANGESHSRAWAGRKATPAAAEVPAAKKTTRAKKAPTKAPPMRPMAARSREPKEGENISSGTLNRGDRIMVTQDADGNWIRTNNKRGSRPITIDSIERVPMGRQMGYRFHGKDDEGNDVTTQDYFGQNTFKIGPPKPEGAPAAAVKKATRAKKAVPAEKVTPPTKRTLEQNMTNLRAATTPEEADAALDKLSERQLGDIRTEIDASPPPQGSSWTRAHSRRAIVGKLFPEAKKAAPGRPTITRAAKKAEPAAPSKPKVPDALLREREAAEKSLAKLPLRGGTRNEMAQKNQLQRRIAELDLAKDPESQAPENLTPEQRAKWAQIYQDMVVQGYGDETGRREAGIALFRDDLAARKAAKATPEAPAVPVRRELPDREAGREDAKLREYADELDKTLTPAQKTQLYNAKLSNSTKRTYYEGRRSGDSHTKALRAAKAEQTRLREEFEKNNAPITPDSAKAAKKAVRAARPVTIKRAADVPGNARDKRRFEGTDDKSTVKARVDELVGGGSTSAAAWRTALDEHDFRQKEAGAPAAPTKKVAAKRVTKAAKATEAPGGLLQRVVRDLEQDKSDREQRSATKVVAPKKPLAGYQDTGEVVPEANREGLHVSSQRWGGYGVYDGNQQRVEADYKTEATAQRRVRDLQAGDTVKKIVPKERTERQKKADEREAARQNALRQTQAPEKKATPAPEPAVAEEAPVKKAARKVAAKRSTAFRPPPEKVVEPGAEPAKAARTVTFPRPERGTPMGGPFGVHKRRYDALPSDEARARVRVAARDVYGPTAAGPSIAWVRALDAYDDGNLPEAPRMRPLRVPTKDAPTVAKKALTPGTAAADEKVRAVLDKLSPELRGDIYDVLEPEQRDRIKAAIDRAEERRAARKAARVAKKTAPEAPVKKAAKKVAPLTLTELEDTGLGSDTETMYNELISRGISKKVALRRAKAAQDVFDAASHRAGVKNINHKTVLGDSRELSRARTMKTKYGDLLSADERAQVEALPADDQTVYWARRATNVPHEYAVSDLGDKRPAPTRRVTVKRGGKAVTAAEARRESALDAVGASKLEGNEEGSGAYNNIARNLRSGDWTPGRARVEAISANRFWRERAREAGDNGRATPRERARIRAKHEKTAAQYDELAKSITESQSKDKIDARRYEEVAAPKKRSITKARTPRVKAETQTNAEDQAARETMQPFLDEAGVDFGGLSDVDKTGITLMGLGLNDGRISRPEVARRLGGSRNKALKKVGEAVGRSRGRKTAKKTAVEEPRFQPVLQQDNVTDILDDYNAKNVTKKTAVKRLRDEGTIEANDLADGLEGKEIGATRRSTPRAKRAAKTAPQAVAPQLARRPPRGEDTQKLADALTPSQVEQINDLSAESTTKYWGLRGRGAGHDTAWRGVPKGDIDALRPAATPAGNPESRPGDVSAIDELRRPSAQFDRPRLQDSSPTRLTEESKDAVVARDAAARAANPRYYPATREDQALAREAAEIRYMREQTNIEAAKRAPKKAVKKVAPAVTKTRARRAEQYDAAVGDIPGDDGGLLRSSKKDLIEGHPAASVKKALADRAETYRTRAALLREKDDIDVVGDEANDYDRKADIYQRAADLAGKRVPRVKKAVKPGEKVAVVDLEDGDVAVLNGRKGVFRQPKPRTTFIEFPDGSQEKVVKSRLASMVRAKELELKGGDHRANAPEGDVAEAPIKKVTVTRAAPSKKVGVRKAAAKKAAPEEAAPEAPAKKAIAKKTPTKKAVAKKAIAKKAPARKAAKVAPDGAEAPRTRPMAAPATERDTPRSIDADLQAGRITRAEARERIRRINREDFRADRQAVRDAEPQPEAAKLTRAGRREERRVASEQRAAIRAEGRQRREERGADLKTEARDRKINVRDSAIKEALDAQDGPNAYRAIRRLDQRIVNDREQANLLDYGTREAPADQPRDYTGGLSARSRRLRARAAERARVVDLVWERGHRHEEEQRSAPRMRPMGDRRELTPQMQETRARAAKRAEAAKGAPRPTPRRPRSDNETPRMTEVLDRNFERREAAKKAGPQPAPPARRPRGDNETPRMTEVLDRNFERREAAKAARKEAVKKAAPRTRPMGDVVDLDARRRTKKTTPAAQAPAKKTAAKVTPIKKATPVKKVSPARQQRVERAAAEELAKTAADLEENIDKDASDRALLHRVRARLSRLKIKDVGGEYVWQRPGGDVHLESDVTPTEDADILAARRLAGLGRAVQQNISDRPAMRTAIRQNLTEHGLTPVGAAGDATKYDPEIHRPMRPLPKGTSVQVVHPGYQWRKPDGSTETVLQPLVTEAPAKAAKAATPAAPAAKKARPTITRQAKKAVPAAATTPTSREELEKLSRTRLRELLPEGTTLGPRTKKEDLVEALVGNEPDGKYHRSETPRIKALREAVESGTVDEKALANDVSVNVNRVAQVRAGNGQRLVRTRLKQDDYLTPERQADAATLSARFAEEMGVDAPAAYRPTKDTVFQEHVDGKLASTLNAEQLREKLDTPEGRAIHLMDLITGNPDRHAGNMMVDAKTGKIKAIDHNINFANDADDSKGPDGGIRPVPPSFYDPFRRWMGATTGTYTRTGVGRDDYQWADEVPFSRKEVQDARRALVRTRPEFIAAGRKQWYDQALARADALLKRAKPDARPAKATKAAPIKKATPAAPAATGRDADLVGMRKPELLQTARREGVPSPGRFDAEELRRQIASARDVGPIDPNSDLGVDARLRELGLPTSATQIRALAKDQIPGARTMRAVQLKREFVERMEKGDFKGELAKEAAAPAKKAARPTITRQAAKKAAPRVTAAQARKRVAGSAKSRTQAPADYRRFKVPEDKASWNTEFPEYRPRPFTADVVKDNDETKKPEGWNDPKRYWADPMDVKDVKRKFRSYEGEVALDELGRPVNPYTRTGVQERGELGKWGANFAGDPIVTRIDPKTGRLQMLTINRKDGQPAIPGGMVDFNEDIFETLRRELKEETGVDLTFDQAKKIYQGYVDDPRNTDNAWMETSAFHRHLDAADGDRLEKFDPEDADEIKGVHWVDIDKDMLDGLYASHGSLVREAMRRLLTDSDSELTPTQKTDLRRALRGGAAKKAPPKTLTKAETKALPDQPDEAPPSPRAAKAAARRAADVETKRRQTRQAHIDQLRETTKLTSRLDDALHGASSDRAINHHLDSAGSPEQRDRLKAAFRDGGREGLQKELEKVEKENGLTRTVKPGDMVAYDPKVHRLERPNAKDQEGIKPGEQVMAVSSGYTADIPGDKDRLTLEPASVARVVAPTKADRKAGVPAVSARRLSDDGIGSTWGRNAVKDANRDLGRGNSDSDVAETLRGKAEELRQEGLPDDAMPDRVHHSRADLDEIASIDARNLDRLADELGKPTAPAKKARPTITREGRGRRAAELISVYNEGGEDGLRTRLEAMDVDQLKDVIADGGMDNTGLARRWQSRDRLTDLIVDRTKTRATKGQAFRPPKAAAPAAPEARAAPAKKVTVRKAIPRVDTVQKNLLDAKGPEGRREVLDSLHDELSVAQWRTLAKRLGAGTQHGSKQDSRDAIERHLASGQGNIPKKNLRDQLRDADVDLIPSTRRHTEDRGRIETGAATAGDDPAKLRTEAATFERTARTNRSLADMVEANLDTRTPAERKNQEERVRLLREGADNYDKAAKVFRVRADSIDKGIAAAQSRREPEPDRAMPDSVPTPEAPPTAAPTGLASRRPAKDRVADYRKLSRDDFDELPAERQAEILADLKAIGESTETTTIPSNRTSMGTTIRGATPGHVTEARSLRDRFRRPSDKAIANRDNPQAMEAALRALPAGDRDAAVDKLVIQGMSKEQMQKAEKELGLEPGNKHWTVGRYQKNFAQRLKEKMRGEESSGPLLSQREQRNADRESLVDQIIEQSKDLGPEADEVRRTTALDRAAGREKEARIRGSRGAMDLAADLLGASDAYASNPEGFRALARRLLTGEAPGDLNNPRDTRAAGYDKLKKAMGPESEWDTPDKLDAKLRKVLGEWTKDSHISVDRRAGEDTSFDPATMTTFNGADIKPGDAVTVVRPGFSYRDTDGTVHSLVQPTVTRRRGRGGGPPLGRGPSGPAPAAGREAQDSTPIAWSYQDRGLSKGLGLVPERDREATTKALTNWVFDKPYSDGAIADLQTRSDEENIRMAEPRVNAVLRGRIPATAGTRRDQKMIDQALDLSRTDKDTTLHRGFTGGSHILPADYKDRDLTDFEWTEKGYTASTVSEDGAEVYSGGPDTDGFMITFKYPKGSRAIAIQDEEGGLDDEGEVLLPRGLTFKVTKDKGPHPKYGFRQLEVEVSNPKDRGPGMRPLPEAPGATATGRPRIRRTTSSAVDRGVLTGRQDTKDLNAVGGNVDTGEEGVPIRDFRLRGVDPEGDPDGGYKIQSGTYFRRDGTTYLVEHPDTPEGKALGKRVQKALAAHQQSIPQSVRDRQRGYAWLGGTNPEDDAFAAEMGLPAGTFTSEASSDGLGGTFLFNRDRRGTEGVVGTLDHEFAHSLDILETNSRRGSTSARWSAAADQDGMTRETLSDVTFSPGAGSRFPVQLTPAEKSDAVQFPLGVTSYGTTNEHEDFSEAYRLYQAGPIGLARLSPGSEPEPIWFRDLYPARAAILDEMMPDFAAKQRGEIQKVRDANPIVRIGAARKLTSARSVTSPRSRAFRAVGTDPSPRMRPMREPSSRQPVTGTLFTERAAELLSEDTGPDGVEVRDLHFARRGYRISEGRAWRENGTTYIVEGTDTPAMRAQVDAIKAVHNEMPPELRQYQRGYVVMDGHSEEGMRAMKLAGEPFGPFATAMRGDTFVWGRGDRGPLDSDDQLAPTLRHEASHNAAQALSRPDTSDQWLDAGVKGTQDSRITDFTQLPLKGQGKILLSFSEAAPGSKYPMGVTPYGTSNMIEDWAEAAEFYFGTDRRGGVVGTGRLTPGGPEYPVWFRDLFPARAAMLDQYFPEFAAAQLEEIRRQRGDV